jgi:hypothetical protein
MSPRFGLISRKEATHQGDLHRSLTKEPTQIGTVKTRCDTHDTN